MFGRTLLYDALSGHLGDEAHDPPADLLGGLVGVVVELLRLLALQLAQRRQAARLEIEGRARHHVRHHGARRREADRTVVVELADEVT